MTFWAYMLHCRGGYYYVGQTDDLELRVAQHQKGIVPGFTADHRPVELVWSEAFANRVDAKAAEARIKGWSRAKKMALIRGDWAEISSLAKGKGSPSTSSGRAELGEVQLTKCTSDQPDYDAMSPEEWILKVPNRVLFAGLRDGPLKHRLYPHPDTPCRSIHSMWATVSRRKFGTCFVKFRAIGDTSSVSWPEGETFETHDWVKADELWRHSCFEIFGRIGKQEPYIEINLSPAKKWASYWFSSYRTDMTSIDNIRLANSGFTVRRSRAELSARLQLPIEYEDQDIELALSAVIEEKDGTKSYWALRHPPGKPDFHHPDCFAITLEAPEPA